MKLLLLLFITLLSGCASLQRVPGSMALETTWQAANAVDFSQTVTIAREPARFHEADPFTSAAISHHPSVQGVVLYWAAYSLFHLAVSAALAHEASRSSSRGWRWALYAWEGWSLGSSVRNVVHNHSIGIKVLGPRDRR